MDRYDASDEYDELMQKFVEDEISEEEFEEKLDELFDSGDDFLDKQDEDDGGGVTNELAFHVKQVLQIVTVVTLFLFVAFIFLLTKGAALLPIMGVTVVSLLAYYRWKGVI